MGVGADDEVDVIGTEAEGLEGCPDLLRPVDRQVDRPGAPLVVTPLPDRVADRGVVDDGQQLGEMVPENLVEEALVAVVSLAEQSVDGAAILIEVQRMTAAEIVLPQDLPVVVVDSGPPSRYPAIDNDQASGARLDAGRDVPGDVSVVGFDDMP